MNRKSGLGRGLGSLIPADISGPGESSGGGDELRNVPVSAIEPNEYQPRARFDEEALVSLTDSVRELGVLQPILVREREDGGYELIAGERRWRAAKRAGLPDIPAVIRRIDDQTSLEHAVVENLHREDLNALEEAAAYQQLISDFGLTQDEVATRVGKSRSAVTNTLRLFQLPGSVQRQVAGGELGAGHARALLGCHDRAELQRLADVIVREGWSVREVERAVRELSSDPSEVGEGASADALEPSQHDSEQSTPRPGAVKPAAVLELEELLADHLDTRVRISGGEGNGRVSIDFADLADLERIYRRMVQG